MIDKIRWAVHYSKEELCEKIEALEKQLAAIEHVTHGKITENIQLRDTIDTLESKSARLQELINTALAVLDKIAKYLEPQMVETEEQLYCPNSPLAPGEVCFCGLPAKPSSLVTSSEDCNEQLQGEPLVRNHHRGIAFKVNEHRLGEVLYRYLVRSADCRTIQGAKKIIPVLEKEILKSLVVEDELGGNSHRNIHTMNCEEIRKYLQINCTRTETDEEISLRMWEEFWVEKHEYPSDIKLDQFSDWLYKAFPDWLKERK